jgi:hypothetical protein
VRADTRRNDKQLGIYLAFVRRLRWHTNPSQPLRSLPSHQPQSQASVIHHPFAQASQPSPVPNTQDAVSICHPRTTPPLALTPSIQKVTRDGVNISLVRCPPKLPSSKGRQGGLSIPNFSLYSLAARSNYQTQTRTRETSCSTSHALSRLPDFREIHLASQPASALRPSPPPQICTILRHRRARSEGLGAALVSVDPR